MMPGAKVNLLIVDDEPSTRRALSEIFTELGYGVQSAEDGFTALVRIRQAPPDILLSDLNMPGISGFELLSAVRDRFPAIRAIAMSGDFSGIAIPSGVCAEAFYEKGSSLGYLLQIVEAAANAERQPSLRHPGTSMPVWIPSNGHNLYEAAHVTLTCPECLRTFPKDLDKASCPAHEAGCVYCYSFDSLRNRPAGRSGVFAGSSVGVRCVDAHPIESTQPQLVNGNKKELRCAT